MANKIDSNVTGLRYAEETTIKNLPVTPIWYPLEPNSYSDFGGQLTTLARNPINPSRQRKKGVITDLDASGGFNQDLTQTNLTRLLQGFFFAGIREKKTTAPMNAPANAFTAVDAGTDTYTASAATTFGSFVAGDLIFASGFSDSANNGLKHVASSTASTVVVDEGLVTEASPAVGAKLQVVGIEFEAAAVSISAAGSYPRLTSASFDFTDLGLIPGEWVYIGGDATPTKFVTAANSGFARVHAVAAGYVEFDKTSQVFVTEVGTGLTVQMFFGSVLKNEDDPTLIVRRTYQLERTLGRDDDGVMSEYLLGSVPNELTLNVKQADKLAVDLTFVSTDNEQRDGTEGVKTGTRPGLVDAPAFNTSSDFSRIKLSIVDGNAASIPLFAFLTDMTLTVNNNVKPNKAIAVLGAFDVSAGTYEVGGKLTAYFASIEAVRAVRNNTDVSLDMAIVKNNAGLLWDMPLIALGDGRLNVTQDESITLPLDTNAAESLFGHTLLLNEFPYLPSVADV